MTNTQRNSIIVVATAAVAVGLSLLIVLWPKPGNVAVSLDPKGKATIQLPPGTKPDADGVIRLAITDDMRKRHQQESARFVDDYFALAPDQRKAFLDKQIELQESAFKMMGDPTKSGAAGISLTKSTSQTNGNNPITETRRVEVKDNAGPKSMMENIDPATRAKIADYMSELNARRAEKGLPPAPGFMMIRIESRTETRPNQG